MGLTYKEMFWQKMKNAGDNVSVTNRMCRSNSNRLRGAIWIWTCRVDANLWSFSHFLPQSYCFCCPCLFLFNLLFLPHYHLCYQVHLSFLSTYSNSESLNYYLLLYIYLYYINSLVRSRLHLVVTLLVQITPSTS